MRLTILISFLAASLAAAQERPNPGQVYQHAPLEVLLPDFSADGLVLDIGGGGEGVIGQLKGKQVVAIDLSKRELEEAPGEPLLKVVMDARELKFLDGTFPTATVFFTFMYIDPGDHEKVLGEIYRVLKPGGRLLVWDATFPKKTDAKQFFIIYPLRVKLPKKDISTGYSVRIREGLDADHYTELAKRTGFQLSAQKEEKGWFALEFAKPK